MLVRKEGAPDNDDGVCMISAAMRLDEIVSIARKMTRLGAIKRENLLLEMIPRFEILNRYVNESHHWKKERAQAVDVLWQSVKSLAETRSENCFRIDAEGGRCTVCGGEMSVFHEFHCPQCMLPIDHAKEAVHQVCGFWCI